MNSEVEPAPAWTAGWLGPGPGGAIAAGQMLAALAHLNAAVFLLRRDDTHPLAYEQVFASQGLLPAVVLRAQQLARYFCSGNPTLRDNVIAAEIYPGQGLLRCVADMPQIPMGDPTPKAFFRALLLQQAASDVFGWHRSRQAGSSQVRVVQVGRVARAFEAEMAREGLGGMLGGPGAFPAESSPDSPSPGWEVPWEMLDISMPAVTGNLPSAGFDRLLDEASPVLDTSEALNLSASHPREPSA